MRVARRLPALAIAMLPILGQAAPKPKASARQVPMDSLGVFVDACGAMMDSITVRSDSLFIHGGGGTGDEFERSASAKDTMFFGSDQIAFIRDVGAEGEPAWFFGYSHRGGRNDWDGAMLLQVHPARRVTADRHFVKGGMANRILCTEKAGRGKAADLSKWDFSGVTLGKLTKLKGLGGRLDALPVESYLIPEMPAPYDPESEDGKAPWDGRTYAFKELAATPYRGFLQAPVSRKHLEFLKPTDDQMRQLGAQLLK